MNMTVVVLDGIGENNNVVQIDHTEVTDELT
jgi:hypothetical protein